MRRLRRSFRSSRIGATAVTMQRGDTVGAADGQQLVASQFIASEHPLVAVDGPALLLR